MKKENLKVTLIILLLVLVILSATYAYIVLNASNNSASGTGGCFEVNYTGQGIDSSSLQSTTNYLEGAHAQITLSKNANCEIYTTAEIFVYTDPSSTAPLGAALKYKILNGDTVIADGSITEELTSGASSADKLLATVPLTEESTLYDIYIWVDSSISNGAYNGKTYSGYLYASSTQTSTIETN